MAAGQVVLYFEKQEDALLFTAGCQFRYVRRKGCFRAVMQRDKVAQGNLQSQSNYG